MNWLVGIKDIESVFFFLKPVSQAGANGYIWDVLQPVVPTTAAVAAAAATTAAAAVITDLDTFADIL